MDHQKNSYDRRDYESVDKNRISKSIILKNDEKIIWSTRS